jgi:hypothetical protein
MTFLHLQRQQIVGARLPEVYGGDRDAAAPTFGRTDHTTNQIEPAVEVNHLPTPGSLMQPVNVLRKENLVPAVCFELRQSMMRVVRHGLFEPPPTDHTSGPIAMARQFVGHECLEANRLSSFPITIDVSVIRNARVRAASGAGQNEQPPMTLEN